MYAGMTIAILQVSVSICYTNYSLVLHVILLLQLLIMPDALCVNAVDTTVSALQLNGCSSAVPAPPQQSCLLLLSSRGQ